MPSTWLQLSVRAHPAALDALCNFLIERGSPGVVVGKNTVRGYFPRSPEQRSVRQEVVRFLRDIRRFYDRGGKARVTSKIIRAENWNRSWRRFIKPQKIGKSFWVTPPWLKAPRLRRRKVITIEPGMAFGTGGHATTRGCLNLIETAAGLLAGRRFTALDVGTGSGILAIALAKLGANGIWAVDNDPVALKVARANLTANGVRRKVQLTAADPGRIRKIFSLVVANLTAETILDLAGALERRVAPRGYLILSGIVEKNTDAVIAAFVSRGFKVIRHQRAKEWSTLLMGRT